MGYRFDVQIKKNIFFCNFLHKSALIFLIYLKFNLQLLVSKFSYKPIVCKFDPQEDLDVLWD